MLSLKRSTGVRLTSGDAGIGSAAKIMGLDPMVACGWSDLALVYLIAALVDREIPGAKNVPPGWRSSSRSGDCAQGCVSFRGEEDRLQLGVGCLVVEDST